MDITGVGNLSYLYNYGISDSDTRHVTGKENGIGSVDENGKQKECQTCKNRKYVDGSNEANVSFKNAAHISPEAAVGGVIAIVEDGDKIKIDIDGRSVNLDLPEVTINERLAKWKLPLKKERGILGIYAKTALQAHEGAMIDDRVISECQVKRS